MNDEADTDPRDRIFSTSHLDGELNRRAGVGALATTLSTPLKILIQFSSVALIARLVSPEEFAVVAIALPFSIIGSSVAHMGLAAALVQRPVVTHALASAVFWTNIAIALAISLTLSALGPIAASFYDLPALRLVFPAMALPVIVSSALVVYWAIMRRRMRFVVAECCTLGAEAGSVLIAVLAAMAGASYWSVVLQQVMTPGLTVLALLIATRWIPSFPSWTRDVWRKSTGLLKFGGAYAGYLLLNQLTLALGTLVSGRIFGDVASASYYRAANLSNYPDAKLGVGLTGVFLPALSRVVDQPQRFQAMRLDIQRRLSLLLMPMGAMLFAGGDLAATLLLGPDWTSTGPLLAWLGLATLFSPMRLSLVWALTAADQTARLLRHGLYTVFVTFAALALGAWSAGLTGMTIAFAISGIALQTPSLLLHARRGAGLAIGPILTRYLTDLAVAGLAAGAGLAARAAMAADTTLAALFVVGLGVVAVYALAAALDPAHRADMTAAAAMLRRRRARRSSPATAAESPAAAPTRQSPPPASKDRS